MRRFGGLQNRTRGGQHCSRLLGHDENGRKSTGREGGGQRHGCNWHPNRTRCHARTDKCAQRCITRRKLARKKREGITHLPGTLEFDDFVTILIYVDFFLQAVSSVLDEDEQERADEPREGVPLHRCVPPCTRESLCRNEHAG